MHVNLRHLLLMSTLGVSTFVAQAQSCPARDTTPACEALRAQSAFDHADEDLNAAYSRILEQVSGPKDRYVDYPALKAKFIKAQRQWVRFRDAECDAWYVINQAGADRNLDKMSCLTDRTKERTTQLDAWHENLP